jgi:putative restriction endonuclease
VFATRRTDLESYFDSNRARGAEKRNIFYVRQSDRLQCLNGAYLSEIDDELLTALFGDAGPITAPTTGATVVSVETGSQIATVRSRLGQSRFAHEIKKLYRNQCCFPGCGVSDPRFLVASHIARWSDNEKLRGQLGNGLCFCLVHDRAFELGLFTLDEKFRIFANPKERISQSAIGRDIVARHGELISLSAIPPLDDALVEHWIRVGIEPFETDVPKLPRIGRHSRPVAPAHDASTKPVSVAASSSESTTRS